ncbi:hypothetical protein MUCCIDRAFT_155374 [Mucor lusitanicus CBS 277.49]|uniref:Uncharacterized protein n=1 Tax=Mucor lusitanicus CBS 277.49 TaxID=747725 RepID=A0A168NSJ5_MUCCL|nr:hypothetical protein MUCCIDRAFT_155374 [Mucor lusitanicus CBS 277.49]
MSTVPFGTESTRRKSKHTKVKAGYRLEESCCVDDEHGRGYGYGCGREHVRVRGDCGYDGRYDCGRGDRVHGDRVHGDRIHGDHVHDDHVHGDYCVHDEVLEYVCDFHGEHMDLLEQQQQQ